jgi:hypothetical protein
MVMLGIMMMINVMMSPCNRLAAGMDKALAKRHKARYLTGNMILG